MRPTQRPRPLIRPIELAPLAFSLLAGLLLLVPGDAGKSIISVGASVLAFAVFIPQAARVWRMRDDPHALLGVSVITNMFIINNSLVWGIYAWSIQEFWVGAAGIVNLPLAAMIVALVLRSRARAVKQPLATQAPVSPVLAPPSLQDPRA